MRNALRLVLLLGLAGCATTGSSHEVHYNRAEVCYVTAPVRAEAHEAEASSPHAAETGALSASSVRTTPASARGSEQR